MRVFIVSLRPDVIFPTQLDDFSRLAAIDSVGRHQLVADPDDADVVLFVDLQFHNWRMQSLTDHPLHRAYPSKSMAYCDVDRPWCTLPGVYVSMPARSFDRRWQRAWLYHELPHPVERRSTADADLLFTFRGGRTHRCRSEILRLRHERAVIEESSGFLFHDRASLGFASQQERFHTLLLRSKFVLCPRGHGTCSFRLLETIAAGRVPVIISDAWLPPSRIEWANFSVRIPEAQIERVPHIIEQMEPHFYEMSRLATECYETYFAPPVAFHHFIELCNEIRCGTEWSGFPFNGLRNGRWLRLWLADRRSSWGHRHLRPRFGQSRSRFVRGIATKDRLSQSRPTSSSAPA